MGQRQRQGNTCVYHGQNTCVYHGQTGTPYRCPWGKNRGREIPVFIMDKIQVFIMYTDRDPLPVCMGQRKRHGHTCLYPCDTVTDREREIPASIGQRQGQGNTSGLLTYQHSSARKYLWIMIYQHQIKEKCNYRLKKNATTNK